MNVTFRRATNRDRTVVERVVDDALREYGLHVLLDASDVDLTDLEAHYDAREVFVGDALPRDGEDYLSYQLIRNVLAVAERPSARFLVLHDARRPDLLREWWTLHAAIRGADLRCRCGLVLWQEIAATAAKPLREFLSTKYGL